MSFHDNQDYYRIPTNITKFVSITTTICGQARSYASLSVCEIPQDGMLAWGGLGVGGRARAAPTESVKLKRAEQCCSRSSSAWDIKSRKKTCQAPGDPACYSLELSSFSHGKDFRDSCGNDWSFQDLHHNHAGHLPAGPTIMATGRRTSCHAFRCLTPSSHGNAYAARTTTNRTSGSGDACARNTYFSAMYLVVSWNFVPSSYHDVIISRQHCF